MSLHVPTTPAFRANAHEALANVNLQTALRSARCNFSLKRPKARAGLPEFEALRDAARAIKDATIADLDLWLAAYEARVVESGGSELVTVLETEGYDRFIKKSLATA